MKTFNRGDWVGIIDIHPDDHLKKYEKQLKKGEFKLGKTVKTFEDGYIKTLLIYEGRFPLLIKGSLVIRSGYPVAFSKVKIKKIIKKYDKALAR